MMGAETNLLRRVMVAASRAGATVFRNNCGLARYPKQPLCPACRVIMANALIVRYGLCTGSSDIIGWTPHVVQPADVGRELAVFTAIEVKTRTGRVSEAQENFLAQVRQAGGRAVVARCVEDVG